MRVVNRRSGVAWPDKLPANRLEADARTRTGDPFITSDEPMSAPVRSSHLRPLSKGGSVDWTGLEVTGADNLVDGWWTARSVVNLDKDWGEGRARSVHPR
jgi:hypothetical protein